VKSGSDIKESIAIALQKKKKMQAYKPGSVPDKSVFYH